MVEDGKMFRTWDKLKSKCLGQNLVGSSRETEF